MTGQAQILARLDAPPLRVCVLSNRMWHQGTGYAITCIVVEGTPDSHHGPFITLESGWTVLPGMIQSLPKAALSDNPIEQLTQAQADQARRIVRGAIGP